MTDLVYVLRHVHCIYCIWKNPKYSKSNYIPKIFCLFRFYPVEDFEETNEIPPEMMSDQGVFGSKHSERSSPIFSEFSESASNGNQIILSQITAVLSMGICAGFIFFLRL